MVHDPPLSVTTMAATTQDGAQAAVLAVAGEIDISSAPVLADALEQAFADHRYRIVLDLRGLTFCDSTGLRTFVNTRARATDAGGWLHLACPTPQIAKVLHISGLDQLFPPYDNLSHALTTPPA